MCKRRVPRTRRYNKAVSVDALVLIHETTFSACRQKRTFTSLVTDRCICARPPPQHVNHPIPRGRQRRLRKVLVGPYFYRQSPSSKCYSPNRVQMRSVYVSSLHISHSYRPSPPRSVHNPFLCSPGIPYILINFSSRCSLGRGLTNYLVRHYRARRANRLPGSEPKPKY